MCLLLCVDFCLRLDTGVGKKLLRFRARFSATAMVAPVNFLGHGEFQRVD